MLKTLFSGFAPLRAFFFFSRIICSRKYENGKTFLYMRSGRSSGHRLTHIHTHERDLNYIHSHTNSNISFFPPPCPDPKAIKDFLLAFFFPSSLRFSHFFMSTLAGSPCKSHVSLGVEWGAGEGLSTFSLIPRPARSSTLRSESETEQKWQNGSVYSLLKKEEICALVCVCV